MQQGLTDYFPEMSYGIFVRKGQILDSMLKEFVDLLTTQKLLKAQY